MSKYGPAWVWPATGKSLGQIPPTQPKQKGWPDSRHQGPAQSLRTHPPSPCRPVSNRQCWPEAWLGSPGCWLWPQEKESQAGKAWNRPG